MARFGHLVAGVCFAIMAMTTNATSQERGRRSLLHHNVLRQSSVCKRWAGQSAIVNGSVYYVGGRVTTSAGQTSNTWTNSGIIVDLKEPWQIGGPSVTAMPTPPDGLPAVSLGFLWSSLSHLYLYGGEFSDSPNADPTPFSLWSYDISQSVWTEFDSALFQDGSQVQRAAEGAGLSIPGRGTGLYLGGHLDSYTTSGWSNQIARVYLPTMVEYTMPGYPALSGSSTGTAGPSGLYQNISSSSAASFPQRADGVMVHIPAFSTDGIVIALAGGTNATFTQMNVIDVYDVASASWYKQATSGPTPDIRVNPCATVAAAADGSSYNIYMYGGQNLIPSDSQTQYSDIWILTVPSFTWIKVDQTGQATPPARAGHMCHMWNGQMVVIGGFVGADLSCDTPGIYVFNASSLQWQTEYNTLNTDDPLNRQAAQQNNLNAVQGSYGYFVPAVVQSVIGGHSLGGATATAPLQTATAGPLVTGSPTTYTVTGTNGGVITGVSSPHSPSSSKPSANTNVGAIVAGVIAALLFLIACYLAFCVWLYRKQLKIYKHHIAMAHASMGSQNPMIGATGVLGFFTKDSASESREKSIVGDSSDRQSRQSRQSNRSREANRPAHHPYRAVPSGQGSTTANSSTDDLMFGMEPTFLGVMLNPRRSLRVVNKD